MTTFNRIASFAVLAVLGCMSAFAQTATPSTTLCAAITSTTQTSICLTSTANVVYRTGVYVDLEYMPVLNQTIASGQTYVTVARGNNNTIPTLHANAQTAWLAYTPTQSAYPGENGFNFGGDTSALYSTCARTGYLPKILVGRREIRDCDATTLVWTPYQQTYNIVVGPGDCAWGTTGTYDAQVAVATGGPNLIGLLDLGASFVPANQIKVTNGGASVNTLSCLIPLNIQPLVNKGITIKYADVTYGVATTTLTSISGGAFSTITMPLPGATETASTVTPVAVGGSVTTSSTTANMAATTAGAFRVSRLTPATPINLVSGATGAQFLLVSENFNQSASAAQVVNTIGAVVYYTVQDR